MKTNFILLLVALAIFGGCESKDSYLNDLENYDEYFNTSGNVVINGDTMKLEYGNLRNIGSIKNSQLFLLTLYNLNLDIVEYNDLSTELKENDYVGLQLDLNAQSGVALTEGLYTFDTTSNRLPFTISKALLNVSNAGEENQSIVKYELSTGSFEVLSNNVYPYIGLPSVLVNFRFEFELGEEKTITGNFIGRVLTSENTDE